MRKSLKQFKSRALARPDVRREYNRIAKEFEFLDEILKAHAAAGSVRLVTLAENVTVPAERAQGAREPSGAK